MISEAEYANLRRKIVVSALVSTKICEWGTPEELISNEKIKKMTKNIEKKLKNIGLPPPYFNTDCPQSIFKAVALDDERRLLTI